MPKDIIMPQMGESVAEGTILKWLIQEGQRVEKDQPIVEISTDKVDTEVPSPVSGMLTKILHNIDETVPVGTVIAVIDEAAEGAEVIEAQATPQPKALLEEKIEEKGSLEKRYSPLVRRLAKEYGVDLNKITGTGAGGRITKEDMLDYIESTQKVSVSARTKVEETKPSGEVKEEVVPISSKRRIIAERMVQSKRTAAHVTTTFEIDMTSVAKYREANKESLLKAQGIHLTYLPFIISAVSSALKKHPVLNSSWTEEGIIIKRYINIGIAVSIEDGLIVPVIRDVDKKSLIEISKEGQDIAKRARDKKLKPEDVQ